MLELPLFSFVASFLAQPVELSVSSPRIVSLDCQKITWFIADAYHYINHCVLDFRLLAPEMV
jgi:hypothetical protein